MVNQDILEYMDIAALSLLSEEWFYTNTLALAAQLLNCVIIVPQQTGLVGGRIVECEAYLYSDPASHSFNGETPRNSAMFMASGTLYTYVSYGVHICVNIVSGAKEHADAILLRAVEPLWGIEYMNAQRTTQKSKQTNGQENNQKLQAIPPAKSNPLAKANTEFPLHKLAKGPGCLSKAMGIDMAYNKGTICTTLPTSTHKHTARQIHILQLPRHMHCKDVVFGPRIGISKSVDYPHRFFIRQSASVSAHKRHY